MAIREFNGTSDILSLAAGAMTGATFGTFGAIIKADPKAATSTPLCINNGSTYVLTPMQILHSGGEYWMVWGSDILTGSPVVPPTAVWTLWIVRKATGSAVPRWSMYNFNTTGWTHGTSPTAKANFTAIGSGYEFESHTGAGSEHFDGRVALFAGWGDEVHWSADTTGDSAIEAAGLQTSLQNWVDEVPTFLCPYNQEVETTAVDDVIGTSNQTGRTGTTVVMGDDPPGFNFALGGPSSPAPNLFLTRNLQNR